MILVINKTSVEIPEKICYYFFKITFSRNYLNYITQIRYFRTIKKHNRTFQSVILITSI